jgi:DNA polymerase-3 subunit epsilon
MALRRKPDRAATLDSVRFVVFDTETSGLDLAKNRILSIAGIAVRGLEVRMDDVFDAFVEQSDVGGATAAVVHGLISGDLAGGATELDAASEFLRFVGDSVLVAHHAAFDVRMLQKSISGCQGAKVWSPVIDTAHLAKRVEVGLMSSGAAHGTDDREAYRLDQLVERYGIEVPERHTAAGDALATALLFQRLLKKAERRGIRTLGGLVR